MNTIKEIFTQTIKGDKNLVNKKHKESGSFLEILGIPSSQSLTIKLGNTIEKCFKNYITDKGAKVLFLTKHGRQLDLHFSFGGTTYYFEIKNNVNLDTEKTKAVINKLEQMKDIAEIRGVLSFRASSKKELEKFAKPSLRSYLFGYNDFFSIFGENLTNENFDDILKTIKNIFLES